MADISEPTPSGIVKYARELARKAKELRASGLTERGRCTSAHLRDVALSAPRPEAAKIAWIYTWDLVSDHRHSQRARDDARARWLLDEVRVWSADPRCDRLETALAFTLADAHQWALRRLSWEEAAVFRDELTVLAAEPKATQPTREAFAWALVFAFRAGHQAQRESRIRAIWAMAYWWSRADDNCYEIICSRLPGLKR